MSPSRTHRRLRCTLFAAAVAAAAPAAAQSTAPTGAAAAPPAAADSTSRPSEWNPYSTSVYSEGQGIPLGQRLSLHFGASTETGYDSNIFYLAGFPVDAGILRLRGRISLATRPPADAAEERRAADPTFAYKLPLSVEYREYLSPNPAAKAQRSVNLMADPSIMLWPAGPVTIVLSDTFVRSADPRNAETFNSYVRYYNRASLLGRVHLGGGRLELGLGGSFQTNLWESEDVRFADNFGVEGQAFARWQVSPGFAASLLVRGGYLQYGNLRSLDAAPLRALLTVRRRFTPWLRASAGAGYGNSFAVEGEAYNGPLATASVHVTAPWMGTVEARYERDFFDSLFANFFTEDRFTLVYDQPLPGGLTAHAEGALRVRSYRHLLDPAVLNVIGYSSPEREDHLYDGRLEVAYRPKPWVSLALTYNLQVNTTGFELITTTGPVPAHYVKHSTFLRADFAR